MKSSVGKLMAVTIVFLMGLLFFMPMRAGFEDELVIPVEGVRLDVGESYTLTYTLRSENAQTVHYSSDDEFIVSVNQYGQIRALSAGKTVVRLEAQGGAKAEAFVEVSGEAVTELSLNTDYVVMRQGDVSGLSCVFNEGATDERVEWRSADPSIVIVDANGRIKAVSGGTTYVIATATNGMSAAAKVLVEVPAIALRITPLSITVGKGATFNMETWLTPENSTEAIASWESSDPRIVSVDAQGTMHAVSEGTAEITAYTESGVSGTATVTVEQSAEIFGIEPHEITIERGESYRFETILRDIGSDLDHLIMWKSSNESAVTVYDGVFFAVATGSAYITAEADGMTSTCLVHVKTSVRDISLNMDEVYLLREQTGTTYHLTAVVTPSDADDTSVTYTSDNTSVANVDGAGFVTLTGGYGTANIIARTSDGPEAVFTVHVVTELPQESGNQ